MKTFSTCTALIFGLVWNARANPVNIQIVGPNNAPIAGAQIEIHDFARKTTTPVETNADGQLLADLTPIEDGRLGSMEVRAAGFGLVHVEIKEAKTRVQLQREKFVAGEVRDAKGQPVEGAKVRISDVAANGAQFKVPASFADAFSARTQGDGSWIIGGLPADATAYAIVDDPTYAYNIVKAPIGANAISEAPTLIATPGASIAGRVTDEAGNGVAGAKVSPSRVVRLLTSWRDSSAQTDEKGFYRIDSLPAGETYIVVVQDKMGRVAKAQQKLQVKAGETLEKRDFHLEAALFVEGTVKDAETGAPLAGLSVTNYGPNSPSGIPSSVSVTTDEVGRYRVAAMPGTNRVYVNETAWPRVHFARNVNVEVTAGQNKTLDFALQKGVSLSGTTVDAKGLPMAKVFLFVNVKSKLVGPDENGASGFGVTSDAQGRWEISGLAPGEVTLQPSAEWEIIAPPGDLPQIIEDANGKTTFAIFQMKVEVPRPAPVIVPVRATGFTE